MWSTTLRIADVRAAVALALTSFEEEHGAEVVVTHDDYWHLPVRAAFDLERDPLEPTDLTVGKVSDDLAEIQGFIASGDGFPAWHSLGHVVGLLRALEDAARP